MNSQPKLLDEILDNFEFDAHVYFQRDFHAPWAMAMAGSDIARFYIVTNGVCSVEFSDTPVNLGVGDILLFPHGTAHILADEPGTNPIAGCEFMASLETDQPHFATGGRATRLLCGHYNYRMNPAHPLIDCLPEMIHLKTGFSGAGNPVKQVLDLMIEETRQDDAGSGATAGRLAGILLIFALRAFAKSKSGQSGMIAALADRRLADVIARIHRDFANSLSLDDLAQSAGMSRSGFAREFRTKTGFTPIDYLARWRLFCAGDLLQTTNLPVSAIAEKCGYGSDIAFSRAFRREYGVSPLQYRRQ